MKMDKFYKILHLILKRQFSGDHFYYEIFSYIYMHLICDKVYFKILINLFFPLNTLGSSQISLLFPQPTFSKNRVPCSYPNKNITFNIDENSNNPHYLAFVIWYQQGRKDITAVQLCEVSINLLTCEQYFFILSELIFQLGSSTNVQLQCIDTKL